MSTEPQITLFIITKNEAAHIAACIQSAKNLVQETVVLDSFSSDNTVQICRDLGAKVYQQPFEDFTKQKNAALQKVTTEWALSLDADETLTPELAEEIRRAVSNPSYDGYELPRVNNFLGGRMYHGDIGKEYILRLVRTQKAKFEGGKVHERLVVSGMTKKLKHVFVHTPYADLENYFTKFNSYTTLAAQTLYEQKSPDGKPPFLMIRATLSVLTGFIKRYIVKGGMLDGMRGLIWAVLSAFYTFVKYTKLWYLFEKNQPK
ncbi:MAG: glycosyltransferase family 2 protein [Elusimicrobiaceae bacterium]|nr:glycosyltransferase family 2 protein [Elusimicrobiaceae bacterium]